jgi:ketosteroid isomerase-like protein
MSHGQSDLEQLKKLNATFIHNYVTNDTASHNKILHPDFIYISSNGSVTGRADYLNQWAHGFDSNVITYWDYRDEFIKLFGAMALVHSVNKYTIKNKDGKTVTGMTIYTDTYVKEKGQWLCVQAQITPIAPEHYRGDETIVRKYINGL